MGTRNLTKVIDRKGVVKVAQYGQWDGYPSGQGVNALLHAYNHRAIEAGLARVRWAEQEELNKIFANFPTMNQLGTDDNDNFNLLYPNLTRDTCADILGVVAWSVGEVLLVDSSDFEEDTLFCEGIYTIDFENRWFIAEYGRERFCWSLDELPSKERFLEVWGK